MRHGHRRHGHRDRVGHEDGLRSVLRTVHRSRVVVATRPAWPATVMTIVAIDVASSSDARLGDAVHHVLAVVPPPVVQAGEATANAEHGTCGEDEREEDSHGEFLMT
jgi:hypothetical protein